MSKQPETLELAAIVDQYGGAAAYKAAAELRRLAAIEEQHGELLEALKEISIMETEWGNATVKRMGKIANAAIEKAEGKA
jgi:hypothetical protein